MCAVPAQYGASRRPRPARSRPPAARQSLSFLMPPTRRNLLALVVLAAAVGAACTGDLTPRLDSLRAARTSPPAGPAETGPPPPTTGLQRCIVSRVHDGDTILCRAQGRLRLIGIDSPELDQQPWGRMATQGLLGLIAVGDTLRLVVGQEARDRHGRLLGYLWRNDAFINWQMIRQGWAVGLEYPPNTRYAEWFRRAEADAEAAHAGLWATDGFGCRPNRHRAGLC